MPIIESDAAKHTAPTAVQIVGSRASNAVHTIADSATMYTVTGMVRLSFPRCGQNHTSSPADATHIATTAATRPRDGAACRASGSRAPMKHKCANRNAPKPNTNAHVHQGIANNQSPVADNSSAGTNHRRSRPMGWATAAAASSTAIDALNAGCNIDPILLKVLDAVPFRLSIDDGIEAVRQRLRDLPRQPVHPELRVVDLAIDGPAGPIGTRIYWPPTCPDQAEAPVVLYFHGGGFVMGDLDTHDGTCRQHAVGADAIVVSVDYRLAPEHPYPAAIEDAWAATRWVAEHGRQVGADLGRIAVAGDSAGGTIAAVIAQRARDMGGPPIVFQLLWYPSTLWDQSLPSLAENADAPILDVKAIAAFSRWYAGEIDLHNPPAPMAPGRAENLADLPPAYIAVAGYDPLRDDGIRYGELLAAAGVPVEVHNAQTLVHGYVGYAGVVPAATEATNRGLVALRVVLHG